MAWVIMAIIVWISTSGHALAQPSTIALMKTGNDLYQACLSPTGQDTCLAYVEGVADAMGNRDAVFGKRACLPKGTTGKDLTDTVMLLLDQGSQSSRNAAAAAWVAVALARAYPCGNAQ